MNKNIAFSYLFLFLCFISLTNFSNENLKNTSDEVNIIKNLTLQWNDCISKQNTELLTNLYASQVTHYGVPLTKEKIILSKKDFFKKHSDFSQKIIGPIKTIKLSDKKYKSIFQKLSVFNNKSAIVEAYLCFDQIGSLWKITSESDNSTDRVITKAIDRKSKKFTSCLDVVLEILRTSPEYIKTTKGLYETVVKNGGTSHGITVNGSPNPERDKALGYSKNFELSLHETYPDRMPTLEHYVFDTTKRKLYRYDTANDSLIPIIFNKNLIKDYLSLCK
ncbi:hypothetical protein [Flavobacterium sp. H122]|uniref:hypothetical protein n=1 Tax=Flavobacterium sp. H122 TaxID=2529860 RepID=UPI0010AA7D3E|nr:hypothetical protein [Flavobacterium sp. H122]